MRGFGCKVLCFDKYPSPELKSVEGVRYVDQLDELLSNSDIISLHCPYTPETKHLINADAIGKMKEVKLSLSFTHALVSSLTRQYLMRLSPSHPRSPLYFSLTHKYLPSNALSHSSLPLIQSCSTCFPHSLPLTYSPIPFFYHRV